MAIQDSKGNIYSVESMIYPHDLQDAPEYSSNKVVFFINVAAASQMTTNKGSNYGSSDTGTNYSLFEIPDSDVIASSGQKVQKALDGMSPITIGKLKRLSKAIALHMPNSIVQRTGVNWTEKDLMEENATAVIGASVANKVMSGDILDAGAAAAAAGASRYLKKMAVTQRATRRTPGNSGQEILFEGVDYRTISFSYSFTPRNKTEADNVMNIIRTFKYHMLPEFVSATEFIYIYPSEFQIKYYRGDTENEYVERQLTAVLMNVTIDYTSLGQFATFKDGMPQKINMSLEFKEIGTPTKEIASFGTRKGV